jgi:hypothetical protein
VIIEQDTQTRQREFRKELGLRDLVIGQILNVVGLYWVAMAIAGVAGAGQQEAFQLLQNEAGIFYALAYLAMFALPLVGRQREILKPALWLQAAAVSGFVMTAMYLVFSLFPIINVPRPLVFTAKVGGFVLACQLAAAGLFYSYRRKSRTVEHDATATADPARP